MFDHMLEDEDLKKEFENYDLDVQKDGAFIKDLIRGTPKAQDDPQYRYEKVSSISYFMCHLV